MSKKLIDLGNFMDFLFNSDSCSVVLFSHMVGNAQNINVYKALCKCNPSVLFTQSAPHALPNLHNNTVS